MDSIIQNVEVGHGKDMTVLQKAEIEDEVIVEEEEGDSILVPFLSHVEGLVRVNSAPKQIRGGVITGRDRGILSKNDDNFDYDFSAWQSISSINGDNPITIDISKQVAFGDNDDPKVNQVIGAVVIGIEGNDNLLGHHYDVNWVNTTTVEINGLSQNGSEDISNAYISPIFESDSIRKVSRGFSGYYSLSSEMIFGTDGTPNELGQVFLNDLIFSGDSDGELQYNPLTVNAPNVNTSQNRSTIKLTREVQNNGSVNIDVNEIAFVQGIRIDEYPYFNFHNTIARDTTSVTISPGSTVSFTYNIRTKADASGGIVANFNELMYRQFTGNSRTVKDINNNDKSAGGNYRQLSTTSRDGFKFNEAIRGVQVGTSSADVNAGDVALDSRIPFGDEDGELFPLGSWIDKQVRDEANNKYYFDINRIFENRGSTDIDIEEAGLYVATGNAIVMIARHKTGTNTVAAGDSIKVTYRFQIEI